MSEWPMVKLGEYCDVIMGQAPKGIDVNEDLMGLPLIAGAGDFSSTGVEVSKWTEKPTKTCIINDIILSVRATVGTYRFADRDYCLGRGVAALRAKDNLDQKYLSFVIDFYRTKLLSVARGATFLQISKADIETLMIPLPPLGEQKRIAEILGGVSKAIQKTKVQLLLVDSLGENKYLSLSKDADTFKSLKDLGVKKITGKSIVAKPDNEHDVNQIIKVSAVSSGRFIASETKPLPAYYEPNNLHEIHQGDLLFARASGSANLLGACCIVDKEIQHLYLPDKVWKLEVDEDILPKVYLLQALRGREFRSVAESHFSSSTGVKNIKTSVLMEFKIPVLKQGQFNDYVHFVKTLDNLCHLLHRKLSLLQELQKSLASRAFAGLL